MHPLKSGFWLHGSVQISIEYYDILFHYSLTTNKCRLFTTSDPHYCPGRNSYLLQQPKIFQCKNQSTEILSQDSQCLTFFSIIYFKLCLVIQWSIIRTIEYLSYYASYDIIMILDSKYGWVKHLLFVSITQNSAKMRMNYENEATWHKTRKYIWIITTCTCA